MRYNADICTKGNCFVTPWTDFRNCRPLADGTSVETRVRYVTPASGGGMPCAANLKTKDTRGGFTQLNHKQKT